MSLDALARKFNDKPLYIVGGAVRNMLLGVKAHDIDITSSMRADDVIAMLDGSDFKVVPSSLRMGTLIIRDGKNKYEYTAFRKDSYRANSGEHQPVEVSFTDDINIDAMRRDFTVNAIYYNILTGEYIDPLHGMDDIKKRILRTTREPESVFAEDGLRLLRLVRFASQLGFSIEPHCYEVARSLIHLLGDISVERIEEEFSKILVADISGYGNTYGYYKGVKMLIDLGAMDYIIPELMAGKGVEQNPIYHKYDVLTHEVEALRYAHESVRLEALIHDIGKPYALKADGNMYNHAEVGATIARKALARLRYPNKVIDEVSRLVELHMFNMDGKASPYKVKKFIIDNHDVIDKFMYIRYADVMASKNAMESYTRMAEALEEMRNARVPMSIRELKVNGNDVKKLGVNPAEIGNVLQSILYDVAINGLPNTREDILKKIRGGE